MISATSAISIQVSRISGQYPFVYGGCANQSGRCRPDGSRQRHHVQQQLLHRSWPPRWLCLGSRWAPQHDAARWLRHLLRARGCGLSRPAQLPGSLPPDRFRWRHARVRVYIFLGQSASRLQSRRWRNPNALPVGGVIDPTFVPCLSVFQGFPTAARRASRYQLAAQLRQSWHSRCSIDRHLWSRRATQVRRSRTRSNGTSRLQRELGKELDLEDRLCRNARPCICAKPAPAIQAQNATPANPVSVTDNDGTATSRLKTLRQRALPVRIRSPD